MRRFALVISAVTVTMMSAAPALGHGTMVKPISRAHACFQENPEAPRSAACKAVVAAGGTQPLYDWNEVNLAAAAGNHRQIIPDGKLCSAGRDKYRGLDLARPDWPATTLPKTGDFTFQYIGTAPHRGTFELYVTKNGFDPVKPLAWSDLETTPFLRVTDPRLVNGVYQLPGNLPGKSGRHLIYSIWQRSDSPEAFYTCSDVIFGSTVNPPRPAEKVPTPPTSAAAPLPSTAEFETGNLATASPAQGNSQLTVTTLGRAAESAQTGGIDWRYGIPGLILVLAGVGLAFAWYSRRAVL